MKNILCTLILLAAISAQAADKKPVKVFILAGQSNMEGKGKVDPLLNHQIHAPETKKFLRTFIRMENISSARMCGSIF